MMELVNDKLRHAEEGTNQTSEEEKKKLIEENDSLKRQMKELISSNKNQDRNFLLENKNQEDKKLDQKIKILLEQKEFELANKFKELEYLIREECLTQINIYRDKHQKLFDDSHSLKNLVKKKEEENLKMRQDYEERIQKVIYLI